MTSELKRKILHDELSTHDVQELMESGKRLDKILKSGDLNQSHKDVLSTIRAKKLSRNPKLWKLLIPICLFFFCIALYFAFTSYKYKRIFLQARQLKSELNFVEHKIYNLKENPSGNKQVLDTLIRELESRQQDFLSIKEKLEEDDLTQMYSSSLEMEIDGILKRFGETNYHIPEEMMTQVEYYIKTFSSSMKTTTSLYFERKEKFFPMIERIFKEKNVPTELFYVSMLESGFDVNALSSAGAKGLWQLMPKTAIKYGLTVNDSVDERTDPVKSTYAAADYFKDLIAIFGSRSSVMLCMAAYNAGEGRIIKALQKIEDPVRNRDFWYLYRMGWLSKETNEYIPKILAFMIVSENPQKYGF